MHCLVSVALVPLLAMAACAERLSATADPEIAERTFYQHVDIQRNPQFSIQGLPVAQRIHYQVISSFEVYEADAEGKRRVVQTIDGTKLLKADPLSQAVFANSLLTMKGQKYTYLVDEHGDVQSMSGLEDNARTIDIQQPDAKGMLVTSVIDKDGWKELAQLTLFQPPNQTSKKTFSRKTTHDWGNLGMWYGQTLFKPGAKKKGVKRYSYQHKLEYLPPKIDGQQAATELPFSIENAKFRIQQGKGEILYNQKAKHVTAVREIFHAQGIVSTNLLGTPSKITINEKQIFTIKTSGHQTIAKKQQHVPSACDE